VIDAQARKIIMTQHDHSAGAGTKTPGIVILLAWLFVGVPLIWGVSQTFKNALNLFKTPPAKVASATTMPTTSP
jgi:hypothetical protein